MSKMFSYSKKDRAAPKQPKQPKQKNIFPLLPHRKASNHAGLLAFSLCPNGVLSGLFCCSLHFSGENGYCTASPKPFSIASAEEIFEL